MEVEELRKKMTDNKNRIEITYKELCKIIKEEEITGGYQREKQKKEWSRYFKFHVNKKKKYIITNVYDIPLPIEENKLENELMNYNICLELLKLFCQKEIEKYGENNIEKIFNEYLHNRKGVTVSCTKTELAFRIGLVNEIFKEYARNPNQLASKLKVNKNTVMEFIEKVKSYYSNDIQNALERLENNNVIILEEFYMGEFIISNSLFMIHEKDKYDDETETIYSNQDTMIRRFTENEKNKLIEIQTRLLKKYNCNEYSEFVKKHPHDIGEYFKQRKIAVFNELKCLRFYKTYDITFTPDFIFYRKKKLENKLTKMFADRVFKNKEKDIIRKIEEINKMIERNFSSKMAREFLEVSDEEAVGYVDKLLKVKGSYENQLTEFKTLINTSIYRYKKISKKGEE